MNPVILDGYVYIGFLILTLLFWWEIRHVEKKVDRIKKEEYNSRKRDENILRAIHKSRNEIKEDNSYTRGQIKRISDSFDNLKASGEASFVALNQQITDVALLAKKGNKDQQEIKTRLHWLKEKQAEILERVDKGLSLFSIKRKEATKRVSTRKR